MRLLSVVLTRHPNSLKRFHFQHAKSRALRPKVDKAKRIKAIKAGQPLPTVLVDAAQSLEFNPISGASDFLQRMVASQQLESENQPSPAKKPPNDVQKSNSQRLESSNQAGKSKELARDIPPPKSITAKPATQLSAFKIKKYSKLSAKKHLRGVSKRPHEPFVSAGSSGQPAAEQRSGLGMYSSKNMAPATNAETEVNFASAGNSPDSKSTSTFTVGQRLAALMKTRTAQARATNGSKEPKESKSTMAPKPTMPTLKPVAAPSPPKAAEQAHHGTNKRLRSQYEHLSWILNSLPHPMYEHEILYVTTSELSPVSSEVHRRWKLYNVLQDLDERKQYPELVARFEEEVKKHGNIAATIADAAVLDLVFNAQFQLGKFSDVLSLLESVTATAASVTVPSQPRLLPSLTSYSMAIQSVLSSSSSGTSSESSASRAVAIYRNCTSHLETTPHLVMSLLRGLATLELSSGPLIEFAIEEFRKVAQVYQFSTEDCAVVLDLALSAAMSKLGRSTDNMPSEEVCSFTSPILGILVAEAYRRTLSTLLPKLIEQFHFQSIQFLERLRKEYPDFHPSAELIDGCVAAELSSCSNALSMVSSLKLPLKHPKSSHTSQYIKFLRSDTLEKLIQLLTEQGHGEQARLTFNHLLETYPTAQQKTYNFILSTFVDQDKLDLSELMKVVNSMRSANIDPDHTFLNTIVRIVLGPTSGSRKIDNQEQKARLDAALDILLRVVSVSQNSSDQSTLHATTAFQHAVDWCVHHGNKQGLLQAIEVMERCGLVHLDAVMDAKDRFSSL